ncbi:hypothetical protein B296_00057484 [Ensete ventricosum]|uniref:Uncharacterized protein n=1 Tax=Ensete ventricosum TaxID=4639 RepID=A0A426XQV7_ENSVE|nr:hypothetical protein B296_00057484 [Ensete ventricosum]
MGKTTTGLVVGNDGEEVAAATATTAVGEMALVKPCSKQQLRTDSDGRRVATATGDKISKAEWVDGLGGTTMADRVGCYDGAEEIREGDQGYN